MFQNGNLLRLTADVTHVIHVFLNRLYGKKTVLKLQDRQLVTQLPA
jgi:predicted site-specific integrase-resolvase